MVNMARSRNTSDCCESILVTTGLRGRKSKPPPSHKTRGWGKTSKPKTSTPELQHPKPQHSNFKTRNSQSQGSLRRVAGCRAQHVLRGLNPSPYPHGHAGRIRLTHWAGWVHTIVLTPRPIPARESNYVPRLETVGGPGSQLGIPAASVPWRLRTQCCISHGIPRRRASSKGGH